MRKILLAAAALAALTGPAAAQARLTEPKLIKLLEIATDPAAFDGTRQEFRCLVFRAQLGRAECAVANTSMQVVGSITLLLERFSGEDRRYMVNECTGNEIRQHCIADIEAEIRNTYGVSVHDPVVTWVDLTD